MLNRFLDSRAPIFALASAMRLLARVRAVALRLVLLALCVWGAGAIAFSPYASALVRIALAVVFALAVPIVYWRLRKQGSADSVALWMIVIGCVPVLAWAALIRPSNERAWSADQQRLAHAEISGDRVTVHNVRNFVYRSTTDYDAAWEDRRYDLSRLQSAWFVVEPFSGFAGAAHTFLSFGFEGGDYLAVSVEIRKEVGESFSPWKGIYRNYEIMYVFGDERDLVQLRTEQRKDTVYLYPLKTTKPLLRALFVDILGRSNALETRPEFYNSVSDNCATNIADHANRIVPGLVPFSWHLLLPGYADERALQLGLIDFDGTLEAARERFRINDRARRAAGAVDFSAQIRAVELQ